MQQCNQIEQPHVSSYFMRAGIVVPCGVIAIVLAACCIYGRTLRYDMIFDDIPAIVENESVHKLTPLFGEADGFGPLKPKPGTPFTARPLVSLSFAVNYHFSQLEPWSYRAAHVVLHAIAAILLWAAIASTLSQPVFGNRFSRYRHLLSFVAAMLWMVHPTHTETVVYLTQRTELLAGLFCILTVYLAIQFWRSEGAFARVGWSLLAAAASTAGMLSKEMMASVPAMVLIYEWTFIGGSVFAIVKRSWMLYLGLVASWLPLVAIYQSGYSTPLGGFNNRISAVDWWMTQSNSFFVYWRMLFCPWPLLLHYHVPTQNSFAQAWPGVIGFAIYSVTTLWLLWRRTVTGFAMLWFFAVLSPTLIIPLPYEEIAERRMYLPLLAVLPYLSISGFVLLKRHLDSVDRAIYCLPSFVVVIAFASTSVATVSRLGSTQTIWLNVLKHEPNDTIAIASQGAVEFNRGEHVSGLAKMQFAFDSDPGAESFSMLYLSALRTLHYDDRLVIACRTLYDLDPSDSRHVYNLASALETTEQIDESIQRYREAAQLDPSRWETHTALATLLAERYELPEAIKHFELANEIHPDFMNCMNLMGVYIQAKKRDKVLEVARKLVVAARIESEPDVIRKAEQGLEVLERKFRQRAERP